MFPFEIVGSVSEVETIAVGNAIRELARLRKVYGLGSWRKLKGIAKLCLSSGEIVQAEIHWYEATGFGRKEYKIKRILE